MDPNTEYAIVSIDNGLDPQNGTLIAGFEGVRVVSLYLMRVRSDVYLFVVLGH